MKIMRTGLKLKIAQKYMGKKTGIIISQDSSLADSIWSKYEIERIQGRFPNLIFQRADSGWQGISFSFVPSMFRLRPSLNWIGNFFLNFFYPVQKQYQEFKQVYNARKITPLSLQQIRSVILQQGFLSSKNFVQLDRILQQFGLSDDKIFQPTSSNAFSWRSIDLSYNTKKYQDLRQVYNEREISPLPLQQIRPMIFQQRFLSSPNFIKLDRILEKFGLSDNKIFQLSSSNASSWSNINFADSFSATNAIQYALSYNKMSHLESINKIVPFYSRWNPVKYKMTDASSVPFYSFIAQNIFSESWKKIILSNRDRIHINSILLQRVGFTHGRKDSIDTKAFMAPVNLLRWASISLHTDERLMSFALRNIASFPSLWFKTIQARNAGSAKSLYISTFSYLQSFRLHKENFVQNVWNHSLLTSRPASIINISKMAMPLSLSYFFRHEMRPTEQRDKVSGDLPLAIIFRPIRDKKTRQTVSQNDSSLYYKLDLWQWNRSRLNTAMTISSSSDIRDKKTRQTVSQNDSSLYYKLDLWQWNRSRLNTAMTISSSSDITKGSTLKLLFFKRISNLVAQRNSVYEESLKSMVEKSLILGNSRLSLLANRSVEDYNPIFAKTIHRKGYQKVEDFYTFSISYLKNYRFYQENFLQKVWKNFLGLSQEANIIKKISRFQSLIGLTERTVSGILRNINLLGISREIKILKGLSKFCFSQNVVEDISREDTNSAFFKSMLAPQNRVDAISIALLILHKIALTNTGLRKFLSIEKGSLAPLEEHSSLVFFRQNNFEEWKNLRNLFNPKNFISHRILADISKRNISPILAPLNLIVSRRMDVEDLKSFFSNIIRHRENQNSEHSSKTLFLSLQSRRLYDESILQRLWDNFQMISTRMNIAKSTYSPFLARLEKREMGMFTDFLSVNNLKTRNIHDFADRFALTFFRQTNFKNLENLFSQKSWISYKSVKEIEGYPILENLNRILFRRMNVEDFKSILFKIIHKREALNVEHLSKTISSSLQIFRLDERKNVHRFGKSLLFLSDRESIIKESTHFQLIMDLVKRSLRFDPGQSKFPGALPLTIMFQPFGPKITKGELIPSALQNDNFLYFKMFYPKEAWRAEHLYKTFFSSMQSHRLYEGNALQRLWKHFSRSFISEEISNNFIRLQSIDLNLIKRFRIEDLNFLFSKWTHRQEATDAKNLSVFSSLQKQSLYKEIFFKRMEKNFLLVATGTNSIQSFIHSQFITGLKNRNTSRIWEGWNFILLQRMNVDELKSLSYLFSKKGKKKYNADIILLKYIENLREYQIRKRIHSKPVLEHLTWMFLQSMDSQKKITDSQSLAQKILSAKFLINKSSYKSLFTKERYEFIGFPRTSLRFHRGLKDFKRVRFASQPKESDRTIKQYTLEKLSFYNPVKTIPMAASAPGLVFQKASPSAGKMMAQASQDLLKKLEKIQIPIVHETSTVTSNQMNQIASKVYQMFEKKIAIEKDRRGIL